MRGLPEELVEEILLNLPVKSLLRFSTVSTSWNSTIHSPEFAKRYRGREMMVVKSDRSDQDPAHIFPLSSLSSPNPTAYVSPFYLRDSFSVISSSDQLWLVESEEDKSSLYLVNPSTRTQRKLPSPSPTGSRYVYGLGYDGYDYKIMRWHQYLEEDSQIYSLRSNSWRKMCGCLRKVLLLLPKMDEATPPRLRILSRIRYVPKGVTLRGSLYCLLHYLWNRFVVAYNAILSFDLSREEYGWVELPAPDSQWHSYGLDVGFGDLDVGVSVLRGMLSVWRFTADHQKSFVVWVMKEDGCWSQELKITRDECKEIGASFYGKPFYFKDNDGNFIKAVVWASTSPKTRMCIQDDDDDGSVVINEKTLQMDYRLFEDYTYVESLVSLWPANKD